MNLNNLRCVTEVDRIVTGCDVIAIRLTPDWSRLIGQLHTLGRTQAVVRNRHAWMSRCLTATVDDMDLPGLRTRALSEPYLAVVPKTWGSAFVLLREGAFGSSRSLAIFDLAGNAVLELCVTREYWMALDRLIAAFQADDQAPIVRPAAAAATDDREPPNDEVDVASLRAAWDALPPGESFDAMLCRLGVGRAQAYRLASRQRAEPIDPYSLAPLLKHAATEVRPVVVRVFSAGGSCAYAGTLAVVDWRNGWLDVRGQCLIAGVNLDGLASAWAVERPGVEEPSVTLEYFDAADRRLLAVALPSTRP